MKKRVLLLIIFLITNCTVSYYTIRNKNMPIFPKYGNYCGFDRPLYGMNPIAVDQLDLACENHDKCYKIKSAFNINCDIALIAELKNMTPKTDPENVARESIISYFKNSPQKKLMEINLDDM